MAIHPGDADALAQLLEEHPGQRHAILAAAATHLGNSTVQRAVVKSPGAKAHGAETANVKTEGEPQAHAASDAVGSTPQLSAVHQLDKPISTTYLRGPGGTVLEAKLSARMYGAADTGEASIRGEVSTTNGKPDGSIDFQYKHIPFQIGLLPDGRLHASTSFTGNDHEYLKDTVKISSKGSSLEVNLSGHVTIPGPHGSHTTIGIGITLSLEVLKKPPRGSEPTGEPVTVALKTLVPTLAAAGAGIGVGLIAKTILEGLAAEVLG